MILSYHFSPTILCRPLGHLQVIIFVCCQSYHTGLDLLEVATRPLQLGEGLGLHGDPDPRGGDRHLQGEGLLPQDTAHRHHDQNGEVLHAERHLRLHVASRDHPGEVKILKRKLGK